MLKEEILKIIRRKQYIIVLTILFGAAILDFLVTCKNYYASPISWVRSAYDCGILKNNIGMFTKQFFTTLFPIVVTIAVSDIYFEEKKLGINNFIYTRTKKTKNIIIKLVSIAIITFFTIFIPLILNFLLTLTAFPIQGYYSANTTYLTLTFPEEGRILGELEMHYPYLNILIYILLRCILGCCFGILSFSFSLLDKFNHYSIIFSGMIFYVLYTGIMSIFKSEFLRTDIFGINNYGSGYMILFFIGLSIGISAIFIIIGKNKENIN